MYCKMQYASIFVGVLSTHIYVIHTCKSQRAFMCVCAPIHIRESAQFKLNLLA